MGEPEDDHLPTTKAETGSRSGFFNSIEGLCNPLFVLPFFVAATFAAPSKRKQNGDGNKVSKKTGIGIPRI